MNSSNEILNIQEEFDTLSKLTQNDLKLGFIKNVIDDIRWVNIFLKSIFEKLNEETLNAIFDSENFIDEDFNQIKPESFNDARLYHNNNFHSSIVEFIQRVWDLSDTYSNYRVKNALYELLKNYLEFCFFRSEKLIFSALNELLFSVVLNFKNNDKTEKFIYHISDSLLPLIYKFEASKETTDKLTLILFSFFRHTMVVENNRPIIEFYENLVERTFYLESDLLFFKRPSLISISKEDTALDNILQSEISRKLHYGSFLDFEYTRSFIVKIEKIAEKLINEDLKTWYLKKSNNFSFRHKQDQIIELMVVTIAFSIFKNNLSLIYEILYFNQPEKTYSVYSNQDKLPIHNPSWHSFFSQIDNTSIKYEWNWEKHHEPKYFLFLTYYCLLIRVLEREFNSSDNYVRFLKSGVQVLTDDQLIIFNKNLEELKRIGKEEKLFISEIMKTDSNKFEMINNAIENYLNDEVI